MGNDSHSNPHDPISHNPIVESTRDMADSAERIAEAAEEISAGIADSIQAVSVRRMSQEVVAGIGGGGKFRSSAPAASGGALQAGQGGYREALEAKYQGATFPNGTAGMSADEIIAAAAKMQAGSDSVAKSVTSTVNSAVQVVQSAANLASGAAESAKATASAAAGGLKEFKAVISDIAASAAGAASAGRSGAGGTGGSGLGGPGSSGGSPGLAAFKAAAGGQSRQASALQAASGSGFTPQSQFMPGSPQNPFAGSAPANVSGATAGTGRGFGANPGARGGAAGAASRSSQASSMLGFSLPGHIQGLGRQGATIGAQAASGNVLSAVSGISSAAAALIPVEVAAVGVAAAFTATTSAVEKLISELDEAVERYSAVNSIVAMSQANSEISRFQADSRRGEFLASGLSDFVEVETKISIILDDIKGILLKAGLEVLQPIFRAISESISRIEEFSRANKETVATTFQLLADAAAQITAFAQNMPILWQAFKILNQLLTDALKKFLAEPKADAPGMDLLNQILPGDVFPARIPKNRGVRVGPPAGMGRKGP